MKRGISGGAANKQRRDKKSGSSPAAGRSAFLPISNPAISLKSERMVKRRDEGGGEGLNKSEQMICETL